MSQVVAALSRALDLTEGQPPGHAQRSCVMGMRLADDLGLDADTRSALFYALLLKDAGCSTNAAPIAALYGQDDRAVKQDRKLRNQHRAGDTVVHLRRNLAPGGSPLKKARHLRALASAGSEGARALTAMRCERGAQIARMVGLPPATAEAIRDLDEHWDGRGYPASRAGEDISLLGRILCLAQTAEVFWQQGGPEAALAVARERRGTWFDPALVDALLAVPPADRLWRELRVPDVAPIEPPDLVLQADDARLDQIAEAFAGIVDAKSPYTARHSEGVADIAAGVAAELGLDEHEQRLLRRTGLLHDLGKLAISNLILDKPGKLDADEWAAMRAHARLSEEILLSVPAFRELARTAGAHHERLDGSGYHRGVDGTELDLHARVLAVADVAEALTADRPYRGPLPLERVLDIMRADAGAKLDADAFAALERHLPTRVPALRELAAAA